MNQNAKLVVGGLLIYALVKSRQSAANSTPFTPILQPNSTPVVVVPIQTTPTPNSTAPPSGVGICQRLDNNTWVNAPLTTSPAPFITTYALDTQAKCEAVNKCSSGGTCYRWFITNCNPAYTGPGTYANLVNASTCKWDVQCIPGQSCVLDASKTPIKKCMQLGPGDVWMNPYSTTVYKSDGTKVDISTEAGCITANQCSTGGTCYEWR